MQIDYNILIAYGGIAKRYCKGAVMFWEGTMPHSFYQIVEGSVKVFSSNRGGKELIQGIFRAGESFGEPPLLLNKCYPSTAQASCDCIIVRIPRERFLNILKDYPDITNCMMLTLAERVYNKANSLRLLLSHTPEEKILTFFRGVKGGNKERIPINYTRQQIADFTGMRVETVIRTLIRMHQKGKVEMINHKVYY